MFEKYPGKMEGLFRHNPYTAFPPAVPGLPPGLPPAVSFGSLQGAFQPKSMNPELPPRLGPMPSGLPQKGTQIPDHFRPPLRKPGKWCAMHVRVAYMILRHQAQTRSGLWSGGRLLSPRRRKTGTSPSHGPSPEYLLLLPRPGLVRKGPGQPRNRCG
uniref:Fibrosin n=1 Tax=Myotis myotis TaxID=51298 RepID=A0A7J7XYM4_MYOMY|nr:fibrosin [Myotis myotis]